MAKLQYKQLRKGGFGRYDLLVSAKVKELIDYYEISSLFVFQKEFNEFLKGQPKKNGNHITLCYKIKVENSLGQIWRHFSGSDKDPILIYEITEKEATNV